MIAIPISLVVLILLYLFLIAPRNRRQMNKFKSVMYAHRGLHNGERAENSMSAFRAAVEGGYGIELDVRLSRDGKLVVFHDDTLKRVCGIDRKMSEMTAAELSGVRLNGSEEGVPTLAEVLAGVDRTMPLCVELKGTTSDTSLCPKVAELLDGYDGTYSVESFNPFLLAWFKKNRPDVIRGQLVSNFFREGGTSLVVKLLCTPMLTNVLSRPDYISYNARFKQLSVMLCEKLFGATMFAWTIRDKELYARVRARGHAAIFQDFEPRIKNER